jgi:hypothetical protein
VTLELIDCYRKDGVFDEVDPLTRYNTTTMLALSEDGYHFSQWTEGLHDPDGENEHVGPRILFSAIGATVLDGFPADVGGSGHPLRCGARALRLR